LPDGRLRVAIPLAIVTLFVAGGWTLQNRLAADRAGEWVAVEDDDLVVGVDVKGTLQSVESARLGPPQVRRHWNFKISMMAPEGSDVKKGQPVLGFDTSEFAQKLDEKRAERDSAAKQIEKSRADLVLKKEDVELELSQAEAALRKAALKLEAPDEILSARDRKTLELEHAIATEQVSHAREKLVLLEKAAGAEIRMQETKRDDADRQVREIEESIRKMMIVAPRDGTVVYLTDRNNEKKKVGDSVWRMEQVIEIPDLKQMIGDGSVDESDAGRVHVGQRVSLRLDAHPDVEYHGTIESLGKTVHRESDQNPLKVLEVTIALDGTDTERMRPGMRFRGTVELERHGGKPVVPRDAIFVRGGEPVVYRKTLVSMKAVPVELGRRSGDKVQVRRGLEAGDRVLLRTPGEASR